MDSSDPQQSYLELYARYVSSTPNIYGLKFRSKKVNQKFLNSEPERKENQNVTTLPTDTKLSSSCSALSSASEQNLLELGTENLSAILFQPGNETVCEKTRRVRLDQHEIRRLLAALKTPETKGRALARDLNLSAQVVQRQAQILFCQIEETFVSELEWAQLASTIDLEAMRPSSFYHSLQEDEAEILRAFQAAFQVTRNQAFSAQYCCRKFGVAVRLVNTLVRQACVF
ncbi:Hypothetical_protein [Hexamita inflata]|uniref:Hypothetical_protein n=1 Tax=Hexamita inflata TaxID=28002 RepID=A0ABP1JXI2_9EUKA